MCQALNPAQIIIGVWIETIRNANALYLTDEESETEWL